MATAISANKAELIAIANNVASEKMIDKAIVIEAMEDAIQRAARARYGAENDIRAKLDPDTGDFVRAYLETYARDSGCAILLASHNMQEVERLCRRAGFAGRVAIARTVEVAPTQAHVLDIEGGDAHGGP